MLGAGRLAGVVLLRVVVGVSGSVREMRLPQEVGPDFGLAVQRAEALTDRAEALQN